MKFLKKLGQKGQTAVEYLLMIAVAVGLGLTFFNKFQQYLLDNPNSYINTQMRFYQNLFDPNAGYKYFRLPR